MEIQSPKSQATTHFSSLEKSIDLVASKCVASIVTRAFTGSAGKVCPFQEINNNHRELGINSSQLDVAQLEKKVFLRLVAIKLADVVDNVSHLCRVLDIDRRSYYSWLSRYKNQGIIGLFDKQPIPKNNPKRISGKLEVFLANAALNDPFASCQTISQLAKSKHMGCSTSTVHKVLCKHKLSTRLDRIAELERRVVEIGNYSLTTPQYEALSRYSSEVITNKQKIAVPGNTLIYCNHNLGQKEQGQQLYLQIFMDYATRIVFASLHCYRHPSDAIFLLKQVVLPFFSKHELDVRSICALPGRGQADVSYLDILEMNFRFLGMKYSVAEMPKSRAMQLYSSRSSMRFLDSLQKSKQNTNWVSLREVLNVNLDFYNNTPWIGFPNFGMSPKQKFYQMLQAHRQDREIKTEKSHIGGEITESYC